MPDSLHKRLEDPEFWARFKAQLPPKVRPSTINCIVAARSALDHPGVEEGCETCGGSGNVIETIPDGQAPEPTFRVECPTCYGTGKHPDPPEYDPKEWRNDEEAARFLAAAKGTPDPPLTEDERERLLRMADAIQSAGPKQGDLGVSADEAAAFLRALANQDQEGE